MVTPVTPAGDLDEAAARHIVELLAGYGLGIFVLGTTGEAASTPPSLRLRLVRLAVEQSAGRTLVYAGIGDNCVATSLAAAGEYEKMGVDGVIAMLPSYFILEPSEMRAYFVRIAEGIRGSLLLYNIPQTTRMSIPLEVIEALSTVPNIVGLKDSENTEGRYAELARRFAGRSDFALFAGVASQSAAALHLGFAGLVPSSGNLVQPWWRDLLRLAVMGDWQAVETLQDKLTAVAAVFQRNRTLGQSLAALKWAMSLRGFCGPDVLPPLLPVGLEDRKRIREELTALNLP